MKVIAQAEVWYPTSEEDQEEWSHTLIKLEHNNDIFQARSTSRLMKLEEIKISDLEIESSPIPKENIYPLYPGELLVAPNPLPDDYYVKKQNLMLYDTPLALSQDKAYPGQLLLQEAKLCEILSRHPHPNIATYRGCVVEEGRITGLCFTKYRQTLSKRADDNSRPLNNEACLRGIEAGIRHLHSLGFVHNDINIYNVMFLADNDVPIIIDFDSCWKEGEDRGMKGATYMWTDGEYDYKRSVRENDFSGLRRIRHYLDDPEAFNPS